MQTNSTESQLDPIDTSLDNVSKVVVDMRKQQPINDPNCEHDYFEDKEDEDTNDHVYVVRCRKCPLGFLVERDVTLKS